ncbi:Uncharacterised protein [Acinetobacter baumannii]|nr:Uncharacterised protein [Acinetobacter baumannii]
MIKQLLCLISQSLYLFCLPNIALYSKCFLSQLFN